MSLKLFGSRDPRIGQAYGDRPRPLDTPLDDEHGESLERRPARERAQADPPQSIRLTGRQRRRRRGFGLVALVLMIAAVLGVSWLVLAYRTGSFAGGGAVLDRKLAEVTTPVREAAMTAADRTGQAVEQAGQVVEAQGAKLRQPKPEAAP